MATAPGHSHRVTSHMSQARERGSLAACCYRPAAPLEAPASLSNPNVCGTALYDLNFSSRGVRGRVRRGECGGESEGEKEWRAKEQRE